MNLLEYCVALCSCVTRREAPRHQREPAGRINPLQAGTSPLILWCYCCRCAHSHKGSTDFTTRGRSLLSATSPLGTSRIACSGPISTRTWPLAASFHVIPKHPSYAPLSVVEPPRCPCLPPPSSRLRARRCFPRRSRRRGSLATRREQVPRTLRSRSRARSRARRRPCRARGAEGGGGWRGGAAAYFFLATKK